MVFKFVRKTIFEQAYIVCLIIDFFFFLDVISLHREGNVLLFCIFNYITYINSYPLNPFISKFRSSRRKPGY